VHRLDNIIEVRSIPPQTFLLVVAELERRGNFQKNTDIHVDDGAPSGDWDG